MEEREFAEKSGLTLIVSGLIIGAIGAAAGFFLGPAWFAVFYLGFLLAIVGFAIAVLHKAGKKTEKKQDAG